VERSVLCARSCAVFFLALAVAAGVATAAFGEPAVRQAAYVGGTLVLVGQGDAARLDFPSGASLSIPLPAGGELTSLAAAGGGWVAAGSVAADGGGRRLLLYAGDERRAHALTVPGRQSGRVRRTPVPLIAGDRLAGIAWLEGSSPRSLAVAVAETRGNGSWKRPRWVSRPGPGSQLALSGAVLDDGTWLLAWSAFDGHDDEIVWSRRTGGSWSPAARVAADDDVPDITPALAAAGPGALLAWSRYDGNDYRLMLARFADGRWGAAEVAGEAGSLYPFFAGDRERPVLAYLSAAADSWTAEELDADGRVAARAELAAATRAAASTAVRAERPVVTRAGDALRLAWPAATGAAEER
jgi:hypothetical protein